MNKSAGRPLLTSLFSAAVLLSLVTTLLNVPSSSFVSASPLYSSQQPDSNSSDIIENLPSSYSSSSLSFDAHKEVPQLHFPTKEEIIEAQKQLGQDIYVRVSNASQGNPTEIQGATVKNTMFITWIGNGTTTVFLSVIEGKGPSLKSPFVFPPMAISLNNTMNASNLQITAISGLTSITWDAIDNDTGMRNVYGSLSTDGENFYSFQISSGDNTAFGPVQPNPHFVIYIERDDDFSGPDDICKGPHFQMDIEETSSSSAAMNSSSSSSTGETIASNNTSSASTTDNNLGPVSSSAITEGHRQEYVCLYRWA